MIGFGNGGAMTYRNLLAEGTQMLREAGIADYETDARLLLEFVSGADRSFLLLYGERELDEVYITQFRDLIKQRLAHIPVQQLIGKQVFMGLPFSVNESVLVPRQDTEFLVEEALSFLHNRMRVLDLCTGSGCILLSLLHYSNETTGIGSDISAEALAVARENAQAILGEDAPVRSCFLQSDLWDGIDGSFDLVVANPPYIRTEVIKTLDPEVREHEPHIALDGGADGLSFYRRILDGLSEHLVPGGCVLFEIGFDEGAAVSKLLTDAGYKYVEVLRDLAGLDRVVKAYKSVL